MPAAQPALAPSAVAISAVGSDLVGATAAARLHQIHHHRQRVLQQGEHHVLPPGRAWLEQSWQRSLRSGHRPSDRMVFDAVSAPQRHRLLQSHRSLLAAAQSVLADTARAVAPLGYFVLLTDAQGTVLQVAGALNTHDPRARAIARVGLDLSEQRVGTTAIGAALAERQAVWLHRTEHFYADAGCYSCAGAAFAGPRGDLLGMLDVTGIDAQERPELAHLAAQAAQRIGTAMLLAQAHRWRVALGWPGSHLMDAPGAAPASAASQALLLLDGDGFVTGADASARTMLGVADGAALPSHISALWAEPWEPLLDGAEHEAVLWSGLRMRLRATDTARQAAPARAAGGKAHSLLPSGALASVVGMGTAAKPLKAHQRDWIQQAVADSRGNVSAAAQALGVSRATVYRALGKSRPSRGG